MRYITMLLITTALVSCGKSPTHTSDNSNINLCSRLSDFGVDTNGIEHLTFIGIDETMIPPGMTEAELIKYGDSFGVDSIKLSNELSQDQRMEINELLSVHNGKIIAQIIKNK